MRRLSLFTNMLKARRGVIVLFYHGVEEQILDPDFQCLHLDRETFEVQMKFLADHFNVIPISDLEASLTGALRWRRRPRCVLTFDDGYRNNLYVAAPILRRHGLPFTVFVNTKHIAEGEYYPMTMVRLATLKGPWKTLHLRSIGRRFVLCDRQARLSAYKGLKRLVKSLPQSEVRNVVEEIRTLFPEDIWAKHQTILSSEEVMNWDETRTLLDYGATIGSHGHEHAILHCHQPAKEVAYQIAESKSLLEQQVGKTEYFAFPNGTPRDISPLSREAVKLYGFRLGFSTIRGIVSAGMDRYILPRMIFRNLERIYPMG